MENCPLRELIIMIQILYQTMRTNCYNCRREIILYATHSHDVEQPLRCLSCWFTLQDKQREETKTNE